MRRLQGWLGLVLCLAVLVQLEGSSEWVLSSVSATKLQNTLQQLVIDQQSGKSLEKFAAKSKKANVGVPTPEIRDGKVHVVIESQATSEIATLRSLLTAGESQIETTYENLIQAWVPLTALNKLSERADVRFVRMPVYPILDQGSIVSEGAPVIGSPDWNSAGLDGRGVKVGILDPGFFGLDRLIGRELPERDRVITRSFRRDGGLFDRQAPSPHGSAVTEIIHDVAPGATLYPTAFSTDVEFRHAADYLTNEQKVSVISTSFNFPSACMTGPGLFENLMASARSRGALWTASAGNNADSYYSGKFNDDDGNRLHSFKDSDENNTVEVVLDEYVYPNGTRVATFFFIWFFSWEASCTGASNDYDTGLSLKGAEKQEFEGCITPPASNLGRDPSSLGRGSYSTAWL